MDGVLLWAPAFFRVTTRGPFGGDFSLTGLFCPRMPGLAGETDFILRIFFTTCLFCWA